MSVTPLLMLDVDGVLNPDKAWQKPQGYNVHQVWRTELGISQKLRSRIWLNRNHGPWLKALDVDMMWATAWEGAANWEIGPRVGLEPMDHVTFSNRSYMRNPDGSHWKLDDLMANADGRPFVWVDDGVSGADTVRVALEYAAPALLYRVDPRWGLTWDDLGNIWQWLDKVS
jgi:hypothetical protein